ncbi:hypothetical protein Naga_102667g1, partial [Nannochloropsis gaditana]
PSVPSSLPPATIFLSGTLPAKHVLQVSLHPFLYPSLPAFALLKGPKASVRVQRELASCSLRMQGHPMLFELLLAAADVLEKEEVPPFFPPSLPPSLPISLLPSPFRCLSFLDDPPLLVCPLPSARTIPFPPSRPPSRPPSHPPSRP